MGRRNNTLTLVSCYPRIVFPIILLRKEENTILNINKTVKQILATVIMATLVISSSAMAYSKVRPASATDLAAETIARIANDMQLQNNINNIALTPGDKGEMGDKGDKGDTGDEGEKGDKGNGYSDGANPGDMQYWDGAKWVVLPAPSGVPFGSTGLNFCKGIPTWGACTYAIGDTGPAGGIVFYVTDGGLHGMEAAPEDQGVGVWGCSGNLISGADGTAIGTGEQNTADILKGCDERPVAASIAGSFQLNGYSDWFLPSVDDLLQLHKLVEAGIVILASPDHWHWSSTELFDFYAWMVNLSTGRATDTFKETTSWAIRVVRAVRAF